MPQEDALLELDGEFELAAAAGVGLHEEEVVLEVAFELTAGEEDLAS